MTQDNKKTAEAYFKAYLHGDADRLLELLDEDAKIVNPPPQGVLDRDGAVEDAKRLHEGFPEMDFRVEDWVDGGDKLALRFTASGVHKGDFYGIPPSGNTVNVTGIAIVTLRDGKIVEDFTEYDNLGLMTQMGVVPEPPQSA